MTGREVYSAALALLFETPYSAQEYYEQFALPVLNILLPELYSADCGLKQVRGKEPLAEPPQLSGLDQELPYEPELCQNALPYGLCAKLVYDDGEMNKVGYFQNLYVNAVNSLTQVLPHQIEDVY